MLFHRRVADPRIRKTSSIADIGILALLIAQLGLGLATIAVSLDHLDGHEMTTFMAWAQGIFTFDPGAAGYIRDAAPIFKLHLFLGLTIFLVFPFTRLVHMFSFPFRVFLPARLPSGAIAPRQAFAVGEFRIASDRWKRRIPARRLNCPRHRDGKAALRRSRRQWRSDQPEGHRPGGAEPSGAFRQAGTRMAEGRQRARDQGIAAAGGRASRIGRRSRGTSVPGKFETDEESLIRILLEDAIRPPHPDHEAVAAAWRSNPERYRSPPLWKVSHILVACDHADEKGRGGGEIAR